MTDAVVTASSTSTEVEEATPQLRQMIRVLHAQASLAEERGSTHEFVARIMEDILSADDEDAIFAAQESGLIAGKDFANRPFLLKADDVSWARSALATADNGGFPFYAILKVTEIATGEEVQLACGGKTFVAVLYALWSKNILDKYEDGKPLVITATQSPNGAYLSLRPYKIPAPAASRGKK